MYSLVPKAGGLVLLFTMFLPFVVVFLKYMNLDVLFHLLQNRFGGIGHGYRFLLHILYK